MRQKDFEESINRIIKKSLDIVEQEIELGIDFANENQVQNIMSVIKTAIELIDLKK